MSDSEEMKRVKMCMNYYKKEYDELKKKYDDLDFAMLALQNDYKDQQVLKNKSHSNNAELRKKIKRLQDDLDRKNDELIEHQTEIMMNS